MSEQGITSRSDPSLSVDSWWRTQSATMALLKHAHGVIDGAEKRIADLERKIRELEDLASTDPLTGLMNRRGFEQFFSLEAARIRRGHSSGAVLVLIDLDRFKEINDTHGHQAGDKCLQLAARALMDSTRLTDGAARLGGDEFVLLLAQTTPELAAKRIALIREKLDALEISWEGRQLRFGASIGAADVTGRADLARAYRNADKALYGDKKIRKEG